MKGRSKVKLTENRERAGVAIAERKSSDCMVNFICTMCLERHRARGEEVEGTNRERLCGLKA